LIKIVECPRDAWQALPRPIPAEIKAGYLRALIAAGFQHIEAVSFVSAAAVATMGDSEQVLEHLDADGDSSDDNGEVEIIGIVIDKKGAERAIKTGAIRSLGFPYSVSPAFLQRHQGQTPEEAVEALEEVGSLAQNADLDLIGYLSMAFGNPYGEAWSIDEVVAACELLIESGAGAISLADTVGLATPAEVGTLVAAVIAAVGPQVGGVEIGVHLHATPEGAAEKIRAAYHAGCRRFDSAIGGMGGCSFAQDALVGNLATETLLAVLQELGAELPPLRPLDTLARAAAEMQRLYGPTVQ
jgi:hydroxymethylglutaryl-CoA lyase